MHLCVSTTKQLEDVDICQFMYENTDYHKDAVLQSLKLCEGVEHPERTLLIKYLKLISNYKLPHIEGYCEGHFTLW